MSSDRQGIFGRREEFLHIFHRASQFTKELLDENVNLRTRLLEIESKQSEAAQDPGEWEKLRQELIMRIEDLEQEKNYTLERLREVEEENQHFAARYVEVEEENNNLANLYVASFQLHATLESEEVLQTILEIVINLVGAEVFAIYELDENTGRLLAVACEGKDLDFFPQFAIGSGVVGTSLATGETFCGETGESEALSEPMVSIPLRVQERPLGAIVIYKLLEQKERFTTLDHELFSLLGGHAATAILASRLYTQTQRKAKTMQGFLGLLTERKGS